MLTKIGFKPENLQFVLASSQTTFNIHAQYAACAVAVQRCPAFVVAQHPARRSQDSQDQDLVPGSLLDGGNRPDSRHSVSCRRNTAVDRWLNQNGEARGAGAQAAARGADQRLQNWRRRHRRVRLRQIGRDPHGAAARLRGSDERAAALQQRLYQSRGPLQFAASCFRLCASPLFCALRLRQGYAYINDRGMDAKARSTVEGGVIKELQVLPQAGELRTDGRRITQVHYQTVQSAGPGEFVGINIGGLSVRDLHSGWRTARECELSCPLLDAGMVAGLAIDEVRPHPTKEISAEIVLFKDPGSAVAACSAMIVSACAQRSSRSTRSRLSSSRTRTARSSPSRSRRSLRRRVHRTWLRCARSDLWRRSRRRDKPRTAQSCSTAML